jgi:hypothetical protein
MPNYVRAASLCIAALAIPESLSAQQQEQLKLTTVLYYDCAVSSETESAKHFQLGVSYLVYADDPSYQVNFHDPARVLFNRPGWAPKGEFALARRTTDGRLFAWLGKSTEGRSFPQIETTLELTPAKNAGGKATLELIRFVGDNSGISRIESYAGECDALSGKAAWERYQNGGPK